MEPDSSKPSELTHVDSFGNASMVDVGDKAVTARKAIALGRITMSQEAARAIQANAISKGDALGVARVAAIQAVKATSSLIPLCHPLPIDSVNVEHQWISPRVLEWRVTVRSTGKTGVEMEALTGASVATLSIYDMAKSLDRTMVIGPIFLEEKTGGSRGDFRKAE
ncbi:MAG: cyclic pyranopterin monophosphate synthase MoaC [Planctomycetota bacterium]|nr:cyclic pyranopterin monophosphate synthase MoaC [Planctomycetota bacterium]